MTFVMIGARHGCCRLPADVQARLAAPLARVSETMAAYLRAIAGALRTGVGRARDSGRCRPRCRLTAAESRGGAGRRPDPRPARRRRGAVFFALGFSLEQMRQNLKDLERCVAEWAGDGRRALAPRPQIAKINARRPSFAGRKRAR